MWNNKTAFKCEDETFLFRKKTKKILNGGKKMLIAASFPSAQIRSIALSCTKYVDYRHNQNKKGFAISNTSKAFYMIFAGFLGLLFRHSFRRNISTFIQLFTKKKNFNL